MYILASCTLSIIDHYTQGDPKLMCLPYLNNCCHFVLSIYDSPGPGVSHIIMIIIYIEGRAQ